MRCDPAFERSKNMSKKIIAVLAVFAMLLTSVGILYNHSVVAVGGEPGSASNDEYLKLGDCNADGVVNSKDIIALKLYLQGESSVNTLTSDVNQDGIINADDISAVSSIIASGKYVMIRNFPEVKEVADGTLLYYENFESQSITAHSYDTVTALKWDVQNTDKGAFYDNTAKYSIVSSDDGKALYIDNVGGKDSYVELLTDSQMGYFHEGNYTLQYDLKYADASSATRYITVLLGYSGDRYMSFHLRNGGAADNQVHVGANWYRFDSSWSNDLPDKLLGMNHDGSTQIFKGVSLSIRYVVDWENGCKIYVRTNDKSTSSGGAWVLASQFSADSEAAAYHKNDAFKAAVAIKTGGAQNGYIDNIMLWTGTGDEPQDKSSPLLSSGYDECYNHAYSEPTCFSPRVCRHCDFTVGTSLSHSVTDGTCEKCGLTSDEIYNYKNFTNISPSNGASVQIANNDVYNWYKNYTQSVNYSSQYIQYRDFYYPNNVTFTWSVAKPADYYRLTISLNSDLSDGESYILSSPSFTHDHLFTGRKYFWRVDAVYEDKTLRSSVYTFDTLMSPRTVRIEGVSNTRDFGGYITETGKRVKQGMIYRGANLDGITDAGRSYMLDTLGIATDMDVRNGSSRPLGDRAKFYSFNGAAYIGDLENAEKCIIFGNEVKVFADQSNYPIYLHCQIGRDRTGTLACVINALLGVDEKTLRMEYELSIFSSAGTTNTPAENLNVLHDSVNSVIRRINQFSGSTLAQRTENFLISACGVTAQQIQSIRNILLEDVNTSRYSVSASSDNYAAQPSDNVGKNEIPYGDYVEGVQQTGYDVFNMMTESEAAANGVPAGYSGHVLALTTNSGYAVGTMLDPSFMGLKSTEIDEIVFRVWCTKNVTEVRLTDNGGYNWIMRHTPSAKEQWIDIALKADGTNFHPTDNHTMASLGDANNNLKPVNLVFRMSGTDVNTVYIDSVTYKTKSAQYGRVEIPYGQKVDGVQVYDYSYFNMMSAGQAADYGVPSGYSNNVLALGNSGGAISTMIDVSDRGIYKWNLDRIIFRVWCPAAVNQVRITDNAGNDWIMRVDSTAGQWMDITLGVDGTNFNGAKTVDDLCDENGRLKPVCLVFRMSGNTAYQTVYIDHIIYALKENDTVPPVITYNGAASLQATEGYLFKPDATAFDAYENRNIEITYTWSEGALDADGKLLRGNHICTLTASDTAGNVSTKTIEVIVGRKDTAAPEILNSHDTVYAAVGSRFMIEYISVDDLDKVKTVYTWSENAFDSVGRLTLGEHTLTLSSTDMTGNKTEKVISVIVKTEADIVGKLICD